jgi:hypothetical protein
METVPTSNKYPVYGGIVDELLIVSIDLWVIVLLTSQLDRALTGVTESDYLYLLILLLGQTENASYDASYAISAADDSY